MAKPTAQQCHAMTTYYISKCEEVTGKRPVVNRNSCRYRWEGMLMDYTPTQARELVDYYLDNYETPDVTWFLFNYDKVDVEKQDKMDAQVVAAARREATKKRLEDWNKRWAK